MFAHHRTADDAAFEGVSVPGLRAEFYRRCDGDRVASVGRYSYGGRPVLLAWGYVDEEHCRYNAVHEPGLGWHPAVDGCPVVRLERAERGAVVGLSVQAPTGAWVTAGRSAVAAR